MAVASALPPSLSLSLVCGLLLAALVIPGGGTLQAQELPALTPQMPDLPEQAGGAPSYAAFNPNFFDNDGTGPGVDVSRFENGTPVSPGEYRLDVYVNEGWIGRMPIRAVSNGSDKNASARYCLKSAQFRELGIDVDKLPPENQKQIVGDCVDFASAVPEGKIDVDLSELTARVPFRSSMSAEPCAAMWTRPSGMVG